MNFEWEYLRRPDWPSLAWLAELQTNEQSIRVHAGAGVECRNEWFCEAVWDGDFEAGDFDHTDEIAGSGARFRDAKAVFVSSGSTIDRLFHLERGHTTYVSNSFVALFAYCGLKVDPTRHDFPYFLASIIGGRNTYQRYLSVGGCTIEATYVDNLVWNGSRLEPCPKPKIPLDFSSYQIYFEYMTRTMQAFIANASAASRTYPLEPLVSMSSGYDSSAVAVLAKAAGAQEAMCIAEDRDGQDDNASRLANHLGYRLHMIDRDGWRHREFAEVDCLAGSGGAGEVAMLGDYDLMRGRLLLTGFHGGVVWTLDEALVSEEWKRKDGSGLCLTEPRLSIGFVHCSIPFWGLNQVRDIYAISTSGSMQRWDTVGSYSRPIPRRLVENAGVPRDWFGIKKRGVSDLVHLAGQRLSPSSEIAYAKWVRGNALSWLRKGRIPPFPAVSRVVDSFLVNVLSRNINRASRLAGKLGFKKAEQKGRGAGDALVSSLRGSRLYARTWALEESMKKYRQ